MRWPATRKAALLVFAFALIVYVFPFAYDIGYKPFFTWTAAQDIASTSLLPIVIIERGDFALDQYSQFYDQFSNTYFVAQVNGRLVSRSPVAAAVLALPFYGVPMATGWMAQPPNAWLSYPWTGFMIAKLAAAFVTALSVLMFFYCARELTDARTSVALALVFGFGTSVWSTASQALWQQTPSLLFQLLGIWFLLRGRRAGANAVAPGAFFFSAATVARANNGLTALLFTGYVLVKYRSAMWRWILWAVPPALLFLAYNAIYNGSPFVIGYQDSSLAISFPQPVAMVGLLASPSRGLFVYSPFLLFALYGLWLGRLERERLFYAMCALAFAACLLLLSAFKVWDGGWGYGTRQVTDVLPYAALLLAPVLSRLRGPAAAGFWAMAGYSFVLQSFGLWDYGVRWHWHWDNWVYNVWDARESEPLFYLKQYVAMAQHFIER